MHKNLITYAIAAILTAISARASTLTFTLDQDGCTGTCGAGPYGIVTLVDNGSGANAFVSVTETLVADERYAGTGAGDALEFSVLGPITIGDVTSGFDIGPAPDKASAFGGFLESVTCADCQGGQASNPAGPLSFTVGSATGVTTDSFIAKGGTYFFASDIVGTNGKTGNVAAEGPDARTPEPGTILLMLNGLAITSVGLAFKKRPQSC